MRGCRVIEVVVRINALNWCYPNLISLHNEIPDTCDDMNVHNQKEDDLRQLHHKLDMLLDIHPLYDSSKSCYSD